MGSFCLLALLLTICSLKQAASEVYYITTDTTDLCTMQPCLTLSQFAANSHDYLRSNTTLVFLPGTHYLSTVNLTLSDVDNFVMKSENSTAQVKCINNSSMQFNQSQSIHVINYPARMRRDKAIGLCVLSVVVTTKIARSRDLGI